MGYGSQEYASGYGPAPGNGYPPPPPSSDFSAYGAAYGAAADYGAGYGAAYPPPPGYGYPGYPPGYGAGYFDGYAYGPPPPGYPGYPPPPGAYPPPLDMPAIGYGPTDSHSSSRGREGGREKDGGRRGGRDEGGNFKKRRAGGGGGGRDKNKDGGYGKADQDNRRNNRSEPYGGGGGGGGRGGRGGGRGGGGGGDRDRESHAEPVPANNLYVTGLPGEFDEDKLKDVFAPHGKVNQCKVLPPRPGETKTVALVRFDTAEEAKKVKDKVNGVTLEGMDAPLAVRFAESKVGKSDEGGGGYASSNVVRVTTPGIDGIVSTFESVGPLKATRGHEHHKGQLYVAGLPADTANVHLYRLFAPFGSIGPKGVHAMMTPDGKCKGIAFVNFLEEESAQLAIATYNGAVLPDGTAMKVSMKMPKNSA